MIDSAEYRGVFACIIDVKYRTITAKITIHDGDYLRGYVLIH